MHENRPGRPESAPRQQEVRAFREFLAARKVARAVSGNMRARRFDQGSDADVELADHQARDRREFSGRDLKVCAQVCLCGLADRRPRFLDPTRDSRWIDPEHGAHPIEGHPLHEVEAQQGSVPLCQRGERGPIGSLEFVPIASLQIGELRIVGVRVRFAGRAVFNTRAVGFRPSEQERQSLRNDREPGGQRPAPSIASDPRRFLRRADEQSFVQSLPNLGAEGGRRIDRRDAALDDRGAATLERFDRPGNTVRAGYSQIQVGSAHRLERGRQIDCVRGDVAGQMVGERDGFDLQLGPLIPASGKQPLQSRPHLRGHRGARRHAAGGGGHPRLGEGRAHELRRPFGRAAQTGLDFWTGLSHEPAIPWVDLESNNRDYRQSLPVARVECASPASSAASDRVSVGAGVLVERDPKVAAWAPDECPDEQVVLDLALGALPSETRRRAWEHVEKCGDCARLIGTALPFLGPETPGNAAWQAAWQRHSQAPEPTSGSADDTIPGLDASDAPERRSLRPGQELRNRYRIVRYVGRGAMGEVFEARHARLVGWYAVKILNVDLTRNQIALQRFRREAAIASELRHPNIVQVIDFDETEDGRPYLVMELLEGQDLGAVIAQGALAVERALALARQIAAGLSAMHERGVVHRDLKPANVFVLAANATEPERVKLVDFGLSKRLVPSLAVTHDRMLLGTPQYMAPEQAQGSPDSVGRAADQFAMAAIVYEMLAGRPAFDGDLLSVVLYRIVYETPSPLTQLVPGLSPHIETAIARALAKDPSQRFPSVGDFQAAMDGDRHLQTPGPSIGAERGARQSEPAPSRAGHGRVKWWGLASAAAGVGLVLRGILVHEPQSAQRLKGTASAEPLAHAKAVTPFDAGTIIPDRTPDRDPVTIAIEQAGSPAAKPRGGPPRGKRPTARHPELDPGQTAAIAVIPTAATKPSVDSGTVEPAGSEIQSRNAANEASDAGEERARPLVPHL